MLSKIILFENGVFEANEIEVLGTKNKSGKDSGIWKTSVGAMKVSGFEKVNYDSKSNSFYMHTTHSLDTAKNVLRQEALLHLQALVCGYRKQNKSERANIYKRNKSLRKAVKSLETIRRLKGEE